MGGEVSRPKPRIRRHWDGRAGVFLWNFSPPPNQRQKGFLKARKEDWIAAMDWCRLQFEKEHLSRVGVKAIGGWPKKESE